MRTELHAGLPVHRAQGRWLPMDRPFRPWVRVAIALAIILAIMAAAVILTSAKAEAAPGKTCKSGSKTMTMYAGSPVVVIGRWTMSFTGCYWNDHAGVASLSVSVSGYANAPYEYRGVIGQTNQGTACPTWSTCTHNNNHLLVRERRVKYEFCLPFAGCVTTAQPWMRLTFDSYGNVGWRTGS
jgi:hypothetical protein